MEDEIPGEPQNTVARAHEKNRRPAQGSMKIKNKSNVKPATAYEERKPNQNRHLAPSLLFA
jgi:hypothetical protein